MTAETLEEGVEKLLQGRFDVSVRFDAEEALAEMERLQLVQPVPQQAPPAASQPRWSESTAEARPP
jgi:hypothetical protein